MINCYNTFDPIKEIMLGDVDHSVIELCDHSQKDRLTHIFNKTKKELNQLQLSLEQRGIVVHRPKKINNTSIKTPTWESNGIKIPLSPRDNFLVLGDTIVETASWQKERAFEGHYWRDVFLKFFKNGARWYSMPMPCYNYNNVDDAFDDDIANFDPMIDNAALIKYGKDIFVSGAGSHNQLGLDWLKSIFPEFRYHNLDKNIYKGHLDTHFTILRPGLLLTYHPKSDLPSFFKKWEIIHVNPDHDRTLSDCQELYDEKIQDDDFANTVLAVNALSIDHNTVMMYDHYKNNQYLINQFNKHNIEIVFVPFTYSHFFNQGLTCITNELIRDTNGCIDYTT